MSTFTVATICSGFGGADIGLEMAGFESIWGIEWEDDIAAIARANGLPIETADATRIDWQQRKRPDLLHMSPPCPNFSVAKTNGKEDDEDRSLALACANAIEALSPRWVTLENVWGYRKSESWKVIRRRLNALGYAWKVNAANYGVPQTRKRMIVCAAKGRARPSKPAATHRKDGGGDDLFGGTLPRWIGWHEAIADLIPQLPDSEFADWQKKRLPDEVKDLMVMTGNTSDVQARKGVGILYKDDPANCVNTAGTEWAFLVGAGGFEGEVIRRDGAEPSFTATANSNQTSQLRALLVNDSYTMEQREENEPSASLVASSSRNRMRAFVDERGQVVRITPRCLARFQSFPDWYDLPESRSLACKGIGNAVPPLLMKAFGAHLKERF